MLINGYARLLYLFATNKNMSHIIDFIDHYGFATGVATYLNGNDSYITQYRNVYQVIWLKKGKVKVTLSSTSKELTVNDCLFLGKNEMFRLTADAPYELHYIQFTEAFYCLTKKDRIFLENCFIFNNSQSLHLLHIEHFYLQYVQRYLVQLKQISRQPYTEFNFLMARNTIQRILLFALSMDIQKFESYDTTHLDPFLQDQIYRFNILVRKHIATQRSVQFYADQLQVDSFLLKDLCKKVYGITAKKILSIACINEAKIFLKHTPLSIKEVAGTLHFADSSAFVRFFKKGAGMSPAQYREGVGQFVVLPAVTD